MIAIVRSRYQAVSFSVSSACFYPTGIGSAPHASPSFDIRRFAIGWTLLRCLQMSLSLPYCNPTCASRALARTHMPICFEHASTHTLKIRRAWFHTILQQDEHNSQVRTNDLMGTAFLASGCERIAIQLPFQPLIIIAPTCTHQHANAASLISDHIVTKPGCNRLLNSASTHAYLLSPTGCR